MVNYITSGVKVEGPDGETFNFPASFIDSNDTSFETGVNRIKMPNGGPLSNIGNNFQGNEKTITIQGMLYDTDESVVTNKNITKRIQMKYWLESCKGSLQALAFETKYNKFSMLNNAGTTQIEGVEIEGTWEPTKGYVIGLSFDEQQATESREELPFSLTLWVAGS